MVGWIVGKLKWLLVICMVGGPIVALSCWQDGLRRQEVMSEGIEAVAAIEAATRVKRRRSGTTYKLDLSWNDAGGLRHDAKDVTISHDLARQVIVEDRLIANALPIKYMRASSDSRERGSTLAGENLIILPDSAYQEQSDHELIYVGAGAGIFGLIGSALMFLPWRRRREPHELAG